ncbi:MAG: YdcF family protein [Clostridia bacterium]|nr:YdcF family protein [Clostridia bacterium]
MQNRPESKSEEQCGFWKKIGRKLIGLFDWLYRLPWSAWLSRIRKLRWKRTLPAICFLLCVGLLMGTILLVLSSAVCDKTSERILSAEEVRDAVSDADCILVLGCRVYADGRMSSMLADRVETGLSLYRLGVSDTLLMSGDRHEGYDEVGAMRDAAISAGVVQEAVLIDPEGYSTYESMVNLAKAYPQGRVVIVTQEYHLFRALYIAERLGLDAYGVSADLQPYAGQWKRDLREILARVKDVFYVQAMPQQGVGHGEIYND